jgi:predicted ATP-grasp superfamily ATP-dependent carboligase
LEQVELVWLVAPESVGILLELSELCYEKHDQGTLFLGCGFDATLTGTSKPLCCEALQAANVHTLSVHAGEDLMQPDYFDDLLKQDVSKWVAKPEDGAGCEGVQFFESIHDLKNWIALDGRYLHYLAQPYQQGFAASFSMLCRNGKSWLLSCNRQHVKCEGNHFKLTGITVNGMLPYWQRFETIARKIAKMLPDALAYVGVDVIVDTEDNNKIYVIEINPRLTTSYVGLGEALACNPAKLVLDCVLNDQFVMPNIAKKQVEIQL